MRSVFMLVVIALALWFLAPEWAHQVIFELVY